MANDNDPVKQRAPRPRGDANVGPMPGALKRAYPRIYAKPDGSSCNICGIEGKLTRDHVPPESCLETTVVEIEPFEHRLQTSPPLLARSQSGVRFKTICGDCNSWLGKAFDPVLAGLCSQVRTWLKRPGTEHTWLFCVDRDALAKSIFGHLVAAATDAATTSQDDQMRRYLMGIDEQPGDFINIFYWIHRHQQTFVMRSGVMPSIRGRVNSPPEIFSFFKVPPLGFMVTSATSYEGLPRLGLVRGARVDRRALPLSRDLARDRDWPERVDPGNFLMVGAPAQDAFAATPVPQRPAR